MAARWANAANTVGNLIYPQDGGRIVVVEPGHPLWATFLAENPTPYFEPAQPPPPSERDMMICTRRQGKLAIGPGVWAQVEALAAQPDTPWALRVAIYDTQEWRRTNEDMDALIWAMGLTPEQADDLFRYAMTL